MPDHPNVPPKPIVPSPLEPLAELADLVLSLAREIVFEAGVEGEGARLTATEIRVMRHLFRHPGSLPTQAARGLGLQRSNFSVAMRGLRDKGLVAAEPDPADGRSVRLFPTERAARDLTAHQARWAAFLAEAVGGHLELGDCLQVLARIDAAVTARRMG